MKTSTDATISRQNTNQPSDSKRRVVAFLQSALKEETEKREQAQTQLLQYRQRSLRIENEFSRLLEKYDNHVAVINGRMSYSQEIWNKLINEIENFNQNSEQMLEKQCGEISAMMNRRIGEIIEKTEYQVAKNKKLSEEQFKTIRQEIKEVLILAKEIDTQNQEVKKMNQQLQFKVNMLREEKHLLVEELAQKKMLLKKLAQYALEDATTASIQSPRRGRSKLSSGRQTMQIPKFMCEPSLRNFSSIVEDPQKPTNRMLSASKDKKQTKHSTLTENHMKLVIEREQRKNKQLKSIVARFQSKCSEINFYVENSLKQLKEQDKNSMLGGILRNIKMKLVAGENMRGVGMTQKQFEQLIVM